MSRKHPAKSNRARQPNKPRTGADSCVVDVLGDAALPYQAERILAEVALATLKARIKAAQLALKFSPRAAREILAGAA